MESSGFLALWKNRSQYGFRVSDNQREDTRQSRRSLRRNYISDRRNIGILTPINSPKTPKAPSSKDLTTPHPKKVVPAKKTRMSSPVQSNDDRLQRLRKWQEEKKKRLEEQRLKKKPVFKACPNTKSTISVDNLTKVYSEIKGMPISQLMKLNRNGLQSNLVPVENYTFKAPADVKPVKEFKVGTPRRVFRASTRKVFPETASLKISKAEPKKTKTRGKSETELNATFLHKDKTSSLKKGVSEKCPQSDTHNSSTKLLPVKASQENKKRRQRIVSETVTSSTINKATPKKTEPIKSNATLSSSKKKFSKKSSDSDTLLNSPIKLLTIEDSQELALSENKKRRKKIALEMVINKATPKIIKTPKKAEIETNVTEETPRPTSSDSSAKPVDDLQEPPVSQNKKQRRRTLFDSTSSLNINENIDKQRNSTISSNIVKTPEIQESKVQDETLPPVIYVSPFVTMVRGKENARKEYKRRSRFDLSANSSIVDEDRTTQSIAATAYFSQLLNSKDQQLQQLCNEWEAYKLENETEEVHNVINVALGQTELLRNKKFQQFKNLIEACRSGTSDLPITYEDLHGYWDTVMIQVTNVNKRFQNLVALKANKWEELMVFPKKTIGKPKTAVSKKAGAGREKVIKTNARNNNLKELIAARRQKKLEEEKLSGNTEEAVLPHDTPRARRRSSRFSSSKKINVSLTMIKATRRSREFGSEKFGETPPRLPLRENERPKSILKSVDRRRSTKIVKSILFKDSPEICDDKKDSVAVRRSKRLSQYKTT